VHARSRHARSRHARSRPDRRCAESTCVWNMLVPNTEVGRERGNRMWRCFAAANAAPLRRKDLLWECVLASRCVVKCCPFGGSPRFLIQRTSSSLPHMCPS
jgi:hypothetical protein